MRVRRVAALDADKLRLEGRRDGADGAVAHHDVAGRALHLADGGDDRRELSGAYNIATGRPRTVLDMAKALVAAASQTTDGSTAGRAAPRVVGGYRVGDVRHVFASPARAAERLRFTAEVGFDEGMADFAGAELRGANA